MAQTAPGVQALAPGAAGTITPILVRSAAETAVSNARRVEVMGGLNLNVTLRMDWKYKVASAGRKNTGPNQQPIANRGLYTNAQTTGVEG
jgi:hypothetical protein